MLRCLKIYWDISLGQKNEKLEKFHKGNHKGRLFYYCTLHSTKGWSHKLLLSLLQVFDLTRLIREKQFFFTIRTTRISDGMACSLVRHHCHFTYNTHPYLKNSGWPTRSQLYGIKHVLCCNRFPWTFTTKILDKKLISVVKGTTPVGRNCYLFFKRCFRWEEFQALIGPFVCKE